MPDPLVFLPETVATPEGELTFEPSPAALALPGQVTALTAEVTALQSQNAGLQAAAAALAPTVFGQPFANRFTENSPGGPRLVFAHFLLSSGDYGKDYYGQAPSVQNFLQDINEAKACGIDGFAVNIGAWGIPYQEAWNFLLLAADQSNVGNAGAQNSPGVGNFFIYAQPDFSGFPQDTATICALISSGISHPSYYRYKGRPFLGTYAGEGGTYADVKARFQSVRTAMLAQVPHANLFFCPFFNVRDSAGNVPQTPQSVSNANEISGLLSGLADACWLFGTGTGPSLAPNSALAVAEMYSQQLAAAGIQWMGTVTPQYLGLAHPSPNHFYIEACGGEALDHQWTSILQSQKAAWVQFVTWNDDDESSNLTNANFGPSGPWHYLAHSSIDGFYKDKSGLKMLNLYYIQRYKTGVRPTIVKNAIFPFYRTQPIGLVCADPLGPLDPFTTEDGGPVMDTFYVAVMAAATSTISVTNAGQTLSKTVTPGLSFVRLGPFMPGNVSFALTRNGQTLVTLAGEPIVSQAAAYNGNYWTGYAHD